MRGKVTAAGVALLGALAMTSPARADLLGAQDCKAGERPVSYYDEVYIPAYIKDAQRGDILLTSGGGGVPREIFRAINQIYNHTMLISEYDDGSGHTLITHDTAISPGLHSLEFSPPHQSNWLVRWRPGHLRRMVPGNVIADRASTLLHGQDVHCLNEATNGTPHGMNDCLAARPLNLWKNANLLLRPSWPLQQQDVIAEAESVAPHSLLYAFGAYSDHLGVYQGSGIEQPWGPGTMCSGFAIEAVNEALRTNLQGGMVMAPVPYSNAQRFSAAVALHNRLYQELMSLLDPALNGPWYARLIAHSLQGAASTVAHRLANQIVNCFAAGGACDDRSDWTSVDPVAFKANTPTPPPGGLWPTAPNSLGVGTSISGDDLLHDANTNGWATPITTTVMGDYYHNKFSHMECCQVDPVTGETTGVCYVPTPGGQAQAAAAAGYIAVLSPGRGGPGRSNDARTNSPRQAARAEEIGTYLMGLDGEFVETERAYCYSTAEGDVCARLPGPEAGPPDAPIEPFEPVDVLAPVTAPADLVDTKSASNKSEEGSR